MTLIKFKDVADNMAFEREEADGLARYVKRAPKDGGYNAEHIATRKKVTFADDDEVIDSPAKKLYIDEDGVRQPTLCTDYDHFVLTAGKRHDPYCNFREDFQTSGWEDIITIMDTPCYKLVEEELGPAWPAVDDFELMKLMDAAIAKEQGLDIPIACHYDEFLPRYLEIAPCDLILPWRSRIKNSQWEF